MKIKKNIISALVLILTSFSYSGCSKDEHVPEKPGNVQKPDVQKPDNLKDDLESLVPGAAPIDADGYTKFYIDNFLSETNRPIELTNGTLYRYMLTPVAEYKLYNLENGKLADSGESLKLNTLDIINMFADNLIFNNKGELKISSCSDTSLQNPSQTLNLTYTYDKGYVTVGSDGSTDLNHIVFHPIRKINKIVKPDIQYFRVKVNDYPDKYIIAEENRDVMDFLNNISKFIVRYGKSKFLMIPWQASKDIECTIYPDKNVCNAFCLNVIIPFFYTMEKYADPESEDLFNWQVEIYHGNMTKENIDALKHSLEVDEDAGVFVYTTGYKFSK